MLRVSVYVSSCETRQLAYGKALLEEVDLQCASLVTCSDKRHVICGASVPLPRGFVALSGIRGPCSSFPCGLLSRGLHVGKPCHAYWRSEGHTGQR